MYTKNISTIQEHHEIVGSRFDLAQIIMKRTKQLIEGAKVKPGLSSDFTPRRQGEIANNRMPKVALEELRTGKLKWSRKKIDTEDPLAKHEIVFGGE